MFNLLESLLFSLFYSFHALCYNIWRDLCGLVRRDHALRVKFAAETNLPMHKGVYKVRCYKVKHTHPDMPLEPVVIMYGDLGNKEHVPLRVHDQCFTSEVLGSKKCDCKEQLDFSLEYIKEHSGVVIYLQQEGRGIGLSNKIAAYALQEAGYDTVDANRMLGLPDDSRSYDSVRDILRDLDIKSVQLLTNNPRKIDCLQQLGIKITKRIPIEIPPNEVNKGYLLTKAVKMNHLITTSSMD